MISSLRATRMRLKLKHTVDIPFHHADACLENICRKRCGRLAPKKKWWYLLFEWYLPDDRLVPAPKYSQWNSGCSIVGLPVPRHTFAIRHIWWPSYKCWPIYWRTVRIDCPGKRHNSHPSTSVRNSRWTATIRMLSLVVRLDGVRQIQHFHHHHESPARINQHESHTK